LPAIDNASPNTGLALCLLAWAMRDADSMARRMPTCRAKKMPGHARKQPASVYDPRLV